METQSQTQRSSRFLKVSLSACFVLTALLWSIGCQSVQTPGVETSGGLSSTPTSTQTTTQTPLPTQGVSETAKITETPGVETPGVFPTQTLIQTPGDFRDVIGISVEGRPLEVYGFGSGPELLIIVAGIHGGYEWNTIALADELIAYLQTHPETIPSGKTLFILRSLNPDGEAIDHGPDGRANANGVDLNRNFPANWQQDYKRSGCWQERPFTAGLAPASEPETQALMSFIADHPGLLALINYHSAGLGVFPGGIPPDPASTHLAESLAAVSGYGYPPIDTGCIYTGQLVDWVSARGIAAVDVELTNHRDTDFEINLKVLAVFLNWEQSNPISEDASRESK